MRDASPAAGDGRKVVTVLFCDLVGFTAASERADREDVRARTSRHRREPMRRDEARFNGERSRERVAVLSVSGGEPDVAFEEFVGLRQCRPSAEPMKHLACQP